MNKKDPDYLKEMEYIKTDIPTEEQQEIEFSGCGMCGKELNCDEFRSHNDFCDSCYSVRDKAKNDLWLTANIISKLIFGYIGKSDLKILNEIIFELAEQDPYKTFEINQTKFAEKHGFKQGNVSRSIKKLIECELLIKNEETGLFQLNLKDTY
jgi:hypothetical protein